jgi:hypothetical protein
MKLYVYKLEDVPENEDYSKVMAIDVIEGADNAECEKQFYEQYNDNDFGCTYHEMEIFTSLKVLGAWYLNSLPMHFVIELENGSLKLAPLSPFTNVHYRMTDYKGHHPRRCKGQPLPEYLYQFYGMLKSEETSSDVVHIRMTPTEKRKLESYAIETHKTVSELVREFVRQLEF